jgi:hypothetical protein
VLPETVCAQGCAHTSPRDGVLRVEGSAFASLGGRTQTSAALGMFGGSVERAASSEDARVSQEATQRF